MKNKKVSVIIPVKEINEYILESIPYLLNQSYKDFEVIIFPDKANKESIDKRIKVIETGNIGPAEKRDLALKYSKGEILAFIDDDAYPKENWLENALENFWDENVAAVGGPNLTPKRNNSFQKASGFALSTFLVSGSVAYRYKKTKRKEIDDFPSCNLFIRKNIFEEVGGFDSKYWPGEDTKLCLEIIKRGKKIIYDPEVVVYHHRRRKLIPYLKQIFSYSKHRGYFAKKFSGNSLKLAYFVPSIFLIALIFGPLLFLINEFLFKIYSYFLLYYIFWLIFDSLIGKLSGFNFLKIAYTIFFTHIIYGIGFIMGLSKKNLISELRK